MIATYLAVETPGSHPPRGQSSCPHDLHPLEGVTPELIEAELLEMMQHVFADARPRSLDIGRAPLPATERDKRSYLASAKRPPPH